jgi:DNA repair photolyase
MSLIISGSLIFFNSGMNMKPKLILDPNTYNNPLIQQSHPWIGSDFPFTLNPTVGCPYGCMYCFSPVFMEMEKTDFHYNIKIKKGTTSGLYKALDTLKYLPQYYKRVQINEISDIYHPAVFNGMEKDFNLDLMREIYKAFEDHSLTGNKFMLHILTKSNLITEHLSILERMKHMVQVEISICSADDTVIRKYEKETPVLKTRLRTIETLANAGIFVRVMAMPFLGDRQEAEKLKQMALNAGAQAFKHKGLNYYQLSDFEGKTWNDYLTERVIPTHFREDFAFKDLFLRSGENIIQNGQPLTTTLPFHNPRKQDLYKLKSADELKVYRLVELADCGYNLLNNLDWGYIK